jgi:hypothetical protein
VVANPRRSRRISRTLLWRCFSDILVTGLQVALLLKFECKSCGILEPDDLIFTFTYVETLSLANS